MSLRQQNLGSIIKPGFNPFAASVPVYAYNLFGWGKNNLGQVGLGNTTYYSSPKQVGSLTGWLTLSSGYNSSFSIKTDGTLWSWGNNSNGQLGLGNRTNYSSPKQVGALTTWSKIGCSFRSVCAIKTDGTLWTWGNNSNGELGLNNTTSYSSPRQVGSLTTWANVSAGISQATIFAIKTDGTLWAWGSNNNGVLGLGNTTNYSSPKQVGALTNWATISTGQYYFAIATKTDGTIWAWGNNIVGQLGTNNRTYYSSPKQLGALTTWLKTATGYRHALAIKTDGALWAWGEGNYGQLGNNSSGQINQSPVQIGALTNWSTVAAGSNSSWAVKTNGTLWSWGMNSNGELGLGNRTYYSSPKQVGSNTLWSNAMGAYYGVLALG